MAVTLPIFMHSPNPTTRALTVLFFALTIQAAALPAGKIPEYAVKAKSGLLEKLDSIDVEKQIRKRKGLSLEDLEKSTVTLKDSVAVLRDAIEKRREPAMEPPPAGDDKVSGPIMQGYQKYAPHTLFDWAVFIVCGCAIVAGVILCIGFFTMVFRKMSKKTRKNVVEKHGGGNGPPPGPSAQGASEMNAIFSEVSKRRMDSLRKRISEETAPPPAPDETPRGMNPPPEKPVTGDEDMKRRIVQAAGEGASINEISRLFHIGADQISLILRVAQKDGDKAI
jgi:hypothetical protein